MEDVRPLLLQKGYGFHSSRQYPCQLNVPSKTRRNKYDGQPYRDVIRGIHKHELDHILTTAKDAKEAAFMIEQLSLGVELSAHEMAKPEAAPASMDTAALAHLIDNRSRMAATAELAQVRQEMADMRTEMSETLAVVRDLLQQKPQKPKHRKKTGSTQRTQEEVDELLSGMQLPTGAPPAVDG